MRRGFRRVVTRWKMHENLNETKLSELEEKEKGSLEKGKAADFILMDTDLINCKSDQILKARVLKTFSNGVKVFEK